MVIGRAGMRDKPCWELEEIRSEKQATAKMWNLSWPLLAHFFPENFHSDVYSPCPHSGSCVGRSAGAEGFARISECLVCSRKAKADVWAVSCSFGKQEEGVRNKEVNLLVCSTSVLVRQGALYQRQSSLTQLRLTWFGSWGSGHLSLFWPKLLTYLRDIFDWV